MPAFSRPLSEQQIKQIADRAEGKTDTATPVSPITPQEHVDAAIAEGKIDAEVTTLAQLPANVYETVRADAAKQLGMRASVLDKLVKEQRAKAEKAEGDLPHWRVVPRLNQSKRQHFSTAYGKPFASTSSCRAARILPSLCGCCIRGPSTQPTSRRFWLWFRPRSGAAKPAF
jgi:hypothetical protein